MFSGERVGGNEKPTLLGSRDAGLTGGASGAAAGSLTVLVGQASLVPDCDSLLLSVLDVVPPGQSFFFPDSTFLV
jgi:hypothetical protein